MTIHDGTTTPLPTRLIALRPLSADTTLFSLQFEVTAPASAPFTPGQFYQLSVPGGGEFPVSPADLPGEDGTLEFCVRQAGHVTSLLHKLQPGDLLGVRGPFGAGFPVAEMEGEDLLLLAGGLGIAPLRSLLLHLVRHRQRYGSITLMYGAREPAAMLFREELVELSGGGAFRLLLTVDFAPEGLAGQHSCAVGLLPDLLAGVQLNAERTWAAVCGPPPLYRCLVGELTGLGFAEERILLSLERRMKCGVGRCCHCAVGTLLCCADGPVFSYRTLMNIPEAL